MLNQLKLHQTVYHQIHGWEGKVVDIRLEEDAPVCIQSGADPQNMDWFQMDGRDFAEDPVPMWASKKPVACHSMQLREERMSEEFLKIHIEGLPFAAVIHHFTGPDRGGAHDHPFEFTSFILSGGYIERIYEPNGAFFTIQRNPGDSFRVLARCIHEIIELPKGECYTLILPGPWEREPGFWHFDEQGGHFRQWNE